MTPTTPQPDQTKETPVQKHPDADPTPILTIAPNITVRALQAADAPSIVKHAANPTIASRMSNTFPHPYTLANAETWINKCNDPNDMWERPGPFNPDTSTGTLPAIPTKFGICIDDSVIGGIGLTFRGDVHCRTAEMGYWIGEAHWFQGLASAIAPKFAAWALETFDTILRLDGFVFEGNPASCRVMEKSGFTRLPRRHKAVWKNGQVLALDCFELVRPDD